VATPDASCSIPAPNAPATNVNVGLAIGAGSDGFCDAQRCIVPLDRQDDASTPQVGWKPAGSRIQLPLGVCSHSPPPLVLVATECPTKTAATATCGPGSSVPSCSIKGSSDGGAPPAASGSGLVLGTHHACTHEGSNVVKCWGSNMERQAGPVQSAAVSSTAPGVISLPNSVLGLALGLDMTCAAIASSSVECWGNGRQGQNGLPKDTNDTPHDATSVLLGGAQPTKIFASSADSVVTHACAAAGTKVWCWGANGSAQLGITGGVTMAGPIDIGQDVLDMALGDTFTCVIRADQRVECWGANDAIQLGRTPQGSAVPHDGVPAGLSDFAVKVAAGTRFACAILKSTGEIDCWGDNVSETVRQATGGGYFTPGPRGGLPPAGDIAAGTNFACMIAKDRGSVTCWGQNTVNQLGSADTNATQVAPLILPFSGPYDFIYAAGMHACVSKGTQYACWGQNLNGELTPAIPQTGAVQPTLVTLP
jgi:alpha-tubulin suppressor-like RCC1 family protein